MKRLFPLSVVLMAILLGACGDLQQPEMNPTGELSEAEVREIIANTPEELMIHDYAILVPGRSEPIITDSLPELNLQQQAIYCSRTLVPYDYSGGYAGTLIQIACQDTARQGAFRSSGNSGRAKISVSLGGSTSSTTVRGGGTDVIYITSGVTYCDSTKYAVSSGNLYAVYVLGNYPHAIDYRPTSLTNKCSTITS